MELLNKCGISWLRLEFLGAMVDEVLCYVGRVIINVPIDNQSGDCSLRILGEIN